MGWEEGEKGKKVGNVRKCVIFGGEAFGRLWHHLAFD